MCKVYKELLYDLTPACRVAQTETGGHIMTPIPGAIDAKPGSCTVPFFGVDAKLLDNDVCFFFFPSISFLCPILWARRLMVKARGSLCLP
jgi:hypothetical protein